MNRLAFTVLYVLGLVTLTLGAVACKTSPEAIKARQTVLDQIAASTQDGIVTPEEVAGIKAGWDAYEAAPKSGTPGWLEPIATVAGTLAAGFLGLRYVPNRMILGTEPDPEVARVAGAPTA